MLVTEEMVAPAPPFDLTFRTEQVTAGHGPIDAPGDVYVAGDVCSGAVIRCDGHVLIGGNVTTAKITCAGELRVLDGEIVGGAVSAGGDLTCQVVGDAANTPTELRIGFNESYLDLIDDRLGAIEMALFKAEDFHARLQPLLQTQRSLTAIQKEQVSEHLYRVTEVKKRALTSIAQLTQRMTAHFAQPVRCHVTRMLHPGVTLMFPGLKHLLIEPIKGPVCLTGISTASRMSIHLTDPSTGLTRDIQAVPHTGRMEALQAALAKLAEGASR